MRSDFLSHFTVCDIKMCIGGIFEPVWNLAVLMQAYCRRRPDSMVVAALQPGD